MPRTKPHRHVFPDSLLFTDEIIKSGWPEIMMTLTSPPIEDVKHTHKAMPGIYLFGAEDGPIHRHETRAYKGKYYGMSGPPVEERD